MSISVCANRLEIPAGFFLTDCAVSGGTLKDFLQSVLEAAQGQLCVRISSMAMDFVLPCFSGAGTLLNPALRSQLQGDRPSFFSQALCMEYFTYLSGEALHGVLYDTQETLKRKLRLAESVGIPMALIEDDELRNALTAK